MIGVGKEDQAVKLPFVPYHTECKYGQVFTTGYNVPHHFSSFFSFPWETWHFSPFPYSCFPHQCRYTRGQPVGFPVLLTQHQWGLGKHHLTPFLGGISAAAVCWFSSPVTIPCWEESWVWVSQRAPGMSLFQAFLVDRARNSMCVNNKPV